MGNVLMNKFKYCFPLGKRVEVKYILGVLLRKNGFHRLDEDHFGDTSNRKWLS